MPPKEMTIETERLKLYAASREQMAAFIAEQSDDVLKAAYTEMLEGCLAHPDQWEWYAIWMIELKNGTHVGELCFKGVENGVAGIGYGVAENYRGCGYATEAVSAVTDWALEQPKVERVMAETEESNLASRKVLEKAGFSPTGEIGQEGLLYARRKMAIDDQLNIRLEELQDWRAVEELVRESFWNVYRPGCVEHFLLKCLRTHADFVRELDFVLERNGRIIGQNVFVKAEIKADDGRIVPILTMGPICIASDCKRQGYGKYLLDYSLGRAAELGYGAVFFEGNIDFYGKSGFDFASNFSIRYHGLPEGADASFFLGKELRHGYLTGISGTYATPSAYFVADANPVAFAEYDATFPAKEKLRLPGQIFPGC